MTYNLNAKDNFLTRYDQGKFMKFTQDMYDVLDSTFMDRMKYIDKFGVFTVTVEEGNPALIAERVYGLGQHQYWWILLYFNDITDPMDIVSGMRLRYPSKESLEKIYFTLLPVNIE